MIEESPWNVKSLYDLQYFNCPSCIYKNSSKQEFVNHAFQFHPEASSYIKNIQDSSMTNIEIPSENNDGKFISIKKEPINNESIEEEETTQNTTTPKSYPTYNNGQAIIYKLFEKQGEKAQCQICFKVLSAINGSTSTLRRHAARFHAEQWNEILEESNVDITGGFKSEFNKPSSNGMMKYDIDEYDDDDNFTEKLQLLQSTQNISISHPRSRVGGSKIKSKKGSRCGKCEGCNQDDCGQCKACLDKVRFGDAGLKKRACIKQTCLNPQNSRFSKFKTEQEGFDHDEYSEYQNDFEIGYDDSIYYQDDLVDERDSFYEKYDCDRCENTFFLKDSLEKHIKYFHEQFNEDGDDNFDMKDDIILKNNLENNTTDHRCFQCGKFFPKAYNLNRHIQSVHEGRKDHSCNICGRAFFEERLLKKHIFVVHEPGKIDDPQNFSIKKKKKKNSESIIHKLFEKNGEQAQCKICSKILSAQGGCTSTMRRHAARFHPEQWSKINEESNETSISNLNKNDDDVDGETLNSEEKDQVKTEVLLKEKKIRPPKSTEKLEKNVICDSCGKSFYRESDLKSHIHIVHEGVKDFKCDTCGKLFAKPYNLKRHVSQVHDGFRTHICDSCGKSFAESTSLKEHVASAHGGKKENVCNECGKSFFRLTHMKRHIRTVHEGRKDFMCNICSKTFSHSQNLKTHVYTVHEGHKDFKCDTCGKSFSKAYKLKVHTRTVHEGRKDHVCGFCGKAYCTAQLLRSHHYSVHEGHNNRPTVPI